MTVLRIVRNKHESTSSCNEAKVLASRNVSDDLSMRNSQTTPRAVIEDEKLRTTTGLERGSGVATSA